jgi:hypothetical protein
MEDEGSPMIWKKREKARGVEKKVCTKRVEKTGWGGGSI